jgi:hypothetical protein
MVIAACSQMAVVVLLALSGRADAAAWMAAACTLTWIAAGLFLGSAIIRDYEGRHAQARSSEDRAPVS